MSAGPRVHVAIERTSYGPKLGEQEDSSPEVYVTVMYRYGTAERALAALAEAYEEAVNQIKETQ